MIRLIGLGDNVVDLHYYKNVMYPGGNAVNFSVYARRLGFESAYIGVLGNDKEGQFLLSALKEEAVDTSRCVVRKGDTGRSGIYLINGDRVINEENDGGVVKSQPLILDEDLIHYLNNYDVIHTSYLSYLDNQLEKLTVIDSLISYDFSTYWNEQLVRGISPYVDLMLLSGAGRDKADVERCMRIAVDNSRCRLAAATFGEDGAVVYDGHNWYRKMPYNYEGGAVDTTGAGDSWITAFIAIWAQGVLKEKHYSEMNNLWEEKDKADFRKALIDYAMAEANAFARYNCQFYGGFGHESRIKL